MAPLIYPEPTWSNRFGRVVRTLQVVAIAGAIGAVGGGVAVMSLVGGSSRQPAALKVSSIDNAKPAAANDAGTHAAAVAPAAPQPDAAAASQVAPAQAAAVEANPQQSPAAGGPLSADAANAQHPIQEAAEPDSASPGTQVYNRVEPEQKTVQAHAPRARAKVTRRTKTAEPGQRERSTPYSAESSRYFDQRNVPYPAARGGYASDWGGPYSGARYSYRTYDPPPVVRAPPPAGRGFFFGGGGGFYDRGGWGD